jgi:hypothetical protein
MSASDRGMMHEILNTHVPLFFLLARLVLEHKNSVKDGYISL